MQGRPCRRMNDVVWVMHEDVFDPMVKQSRSDGRQLAQQMITQRQEGGGGRRVGVCNWGESTIGKVCYGGRDRWRRHTSGSDIKGSTGGEYKSGGRDS